MKQINSNTESRTLPLQKVITIFAVTAALLVIFDRVTKIWAVSNVPASGASFIPGLLEFELVYNRGASFGIMQGATIGLLIFTLIICVALLVYLLRYKNHCVWEIVVLGAIFAGAIGNAYDRLVYGQVTDFLNFEFFSFPVFNVADCCITIGVVLFVIFILFSKHSPFAEPKNKEVQAENQSQDGE